MKERQRRIKHAMRPQPTPPTDDIDMAISTWTDQDRVLFQAAQSTAIMADGSVDPERASEMLEIMTRNGLNSKNHFFRVLQILADQKNKP